MNTPRASQHYALVFLLAALLIGWRIFAITHAGVSLYVDEAQYWTWAQSLQWGYFSKPPGIAALIYLSTHLWGDGLIGVKLLAMLCYPIIAWFTYCLAKRLYDENTAFWSAVSMLFLPIFSWLGLFATTDALLVLCWVAGLLAYHRALASNTWRDWLLTGLIVGAGLLSKYTMLAWIASAFLHLLLYRRDVLGTTKPWVAVLVAVICLSPNIGWNVINDFPTLRHTAEITVERHAQNSFKSLAEFWGSQLIAFGPIMGIAFVLALFRRATAKTYDLPEATANKWLLILFATPLWILVSVQAATGGAFANWAAPAFVPSCIYTVAWLVSWRKRRWLVISLTFNVLATVGMYHWSALTVIPALQRVNTPYARAMGWTELADQLKPIIAAHPQAIIAAESRTIMAHMSYELRVLHPQIASWNPTHLRNDHYRLSTHLEKFAGREVLLLIENDDPLDLSKFSDHATRLATLESSAGPKKTRQLTVYRLAPFKGY